MSGKYSKGPGIFWEKKWGSIGEASYYEHTMPIVWRYLWNYPGLYFQQDGGPGYNTKSTIAFMAERDIYLIFWPAFSPDLSPIESLWNRMKNILSLLQPEVHRNYNKLG
jgi:transposase